MVVDGSIHHDGGNLLEDVRSQISRDMAENH